MTREANYTL